MFLGMLEDVIEVEGDVVMIVINVCVQQIECMGIVFGFIVVLDQFGGFILKVFKVYGVEFEVYGDDQDKMFDFVYEMWIRIIISLFFISDYIFVVILFEMMMDCKIEGIFIGDYLWEKKGIVFIFKIDKGLVDEDCYVCFMKLIFGFDELLYCVVEDKYIFGIKECFVILDDDKVGIEKIVDQQFELVEQVCVVGFVLIFEFEVDIYVLYKEKVEERLYNFICVYIDFLLFDVKIMLKLMILSFEDLYVDFIVDLKVLCVVVLFGGYFCEEVNKKLVCNRGFIVSFFCVLVEGLNVVQLQQEFDQILCVFIDLIYVVLVF